jgi:hypothetical protein
MGESTGERTAERTALLALLEDAAGRKVFCVVQYSEGTNGEMVTEMTVIVPAQTWSGFFHALEDDDFVEHTDSWTEPEVTRMVAGLRPARIPPSSSSLSRDSTGMSDGAAPSRRRSDAAPARGPTTSRRDGE